MEAEAEAEVRGLSRADSFERDLLRRFAVESSLDEKPDAGGGGGGGNSVSDEIELSLGLSLGGSFRAADAKPAKLVRSSSIAALFTRERDSPVVAATPLTRTCSLPAQTEEAHRKRKEMQSLKRLEAKRKRSERRSSRGGAAAARREGDCGEGGLAALAAAAGKVGKFEIEIGGSSKKLGGLPLNGVAAPPGLPPPWAAATRPGDAAACFTPVSQGSIGSQCSSSSGVTDFESRSNQGFVVSGFGNCTETKSLLTVQSLPGCTSFKEAAAIPMSLVRKDGGDKEAPLRRNSAGDMGRAMLEEMPCVSTRGDGPNGQRIEGFLYRYRKGEEVRIVCVCHGKFLTPAEFVEHAGGGDVTHPLRHIVVSPSPSAYLS